jgi:hypothetical protein
MHGARAEGGGEAATGGAVDVDRLVGGVSDEDRLTQPRDTQRTPGRLESFDGLQPNP